MFRPPLPKLGIPLLALVGFFTPSVPALDRPGPSVPEAGLEPAPVSDSPSGEIIDLWRELREWRPVAGPTASVSNLVLVRDAAEFTLEEGTLTLLDIRGTTSFAVFEGRARMTLDVPLEVERVHLARHMEWDAPEVEVERLFLLFADSTASELRSAADFREAQLSGSARDAIRDAMEGLVGEDEGHLPFKFVQMVINGERDGFFQAHIFPSDGDELFFAFDPADDEEVEFGRRASRGNSLETLTSFSRTADQRTDDAPPNPEWRPRPGSAMHYVLHMDVKGLDEVVADAEIVLVPGQPAGRWIVASLYHRLEVDSLRWGDGSPVVYDRSEDEVPYLWIQLPPGTVEGEPLTLRVWYRGDILERRDEFYYLRSTSTWLPRFGSSEATYDMTFRSRKEWPVMSVGRRVSREEDPGGDRIVTRWVTTKPSSQVTFSVGNFTEYEFRGAVTPLVRVHLAERFHWRYRDALSRTAQRTGGRVNVVTQADPEARVNRDIEASLRFFIRAFGPLDFEEYNVAEIPFAHGQAFPGMINLSWLTFSWTDEKGFAEIFRAHEVAHQWWGISVRPKTYHDVWLSEGLSEFSALWFLHRVRSNPSRYFERLEDLRESILEREEKAGPIWFGPRSGIGREGGEDYQVTVYSKGAWVFHMLRNLLIDHDTGSEEAFDGFMKEAFARFKDRTVTTEDFQKVLEEYVGADMQWFFDQWVYGTEIPRYRFAYRTEDLPDGNVKMTVRVRQEGVPEDFTMLVPVLLDFGDDGSAVVQVWVKGRELVTEFPLLPRKPENVTFNVGEAVLAEIDNEGW